MKTVINTDRAPAAIGPYSQAIACNNLLFISGQIPIDPATGKVIEGDISARCSQILKNASEIAKTAGATLDNAVKTTIYLTDLADFQVVNQTYAEFFKEAPPARSTIQVAALPLGVNIEIEFIVAL